MNELQVMVDQEVGAVKWNFEELKSAIEEEMSSYEAAVYDDSMIKGAKADLATLRKLRESVEERRKEIRRKCLEPYGIIESQAKELTGLIDKPIELIDKRVKEFEEAQRQLRKKEIKAFFQERFANIDKDIANTAWLLKYDSRWENATASKKSWQDAIRSLRDNILSDVSVIQELDEDFHEPVLKAYKQKLVLSDAMAKANELKKQKEALIEAEIRRRQEEERQKQEEEARKQKEAEKPEPAPVDKPVETVDKTPQSALDQIERTPEAKKPEPTEPESLMMCLEIYGTKAELEKVKGYIRYIGVKFEEVQV